LHAGLLPYDRPIGFRDGAWPPGATHLEPQDPFSDPLISQIALTIANEIDSGCIDGILAGALNTALAARVIRRFADPLAIMPSPRDNGDFATALRHARELLTLDPGNTQLQALVSELEKKANP
jgi:hypothetical protein